MSEHLPSKIGLSQQFECSYLDAQIEQLLVILDQHCYEPDKFEHLLSLGFRRSGDQIYRPHCPQCNACQSLRLNSFEFKMSKSQKRKRNKITPPYLFSVTEQETDEYFPLYEKYISQRHQDGTMFPPNIKQYESFLKCQWMPISFIELRHEQKLIAVAVTDTMPNALSAIYTFFDPDYDELSLGIVMVLAQLEFALEMKKQYLYLGYQIDECQKMNYKEQFQPAEKFIKDKWEKSKK